MSKTKIEFKIENGKMYSREVPRGVTKVAGLCMFCGLNVVVSEGQLLTYANGKPTHKRCRKGR